MAREEPENTGAPRLMSTPVLSPCLGFGCGKAPGDTPQETLLPAVMGSSLPFRSLIWKPFTFFLVNTGDSIIYK